MRLRLSHIDLSQQMEAIVALIEHSQLSIIDLDLSWCNMNFQNMLDLYECITRMGQEDAEVYNNGKTRGSLRALNLSYNHCLKLDEMSMRIAQNDFELND